jgi:DNA-binding LacI/PurR family transcriptional regulator
MVAAADVARLAQVSTATVSRVINGHAIGARRNAARVEAAMQALNYRVTIAARSLRTAKTRMVLALVPDLANPYYAEIVRGLGAAAREHDYELLLCDSGVSEARERAFAQMLTHHMYDGVICMDPTRHSGWSARKSARCPGWPVPSSCRMRRFRTSASITDSRPRTLSCTCSPKVIDASR